MVLHLARHACLQPAVHATHGLGLRQLSLAGQGIREPLGLLLSLGVRGCRHQCQERPSGSAEGGARARESCVVHSFAPCAPSARGQTISALPWTYA
ncbi:MAG: hypothetical protein ACK5QX_02670 [bacterium]